MTKFEWHQKVAYNFYQARMRLRMPPDPVADWYLAKQILILVPDENARFGRILEDTDIDMWVRYPADLCTLVKHQLRTRERNACYHAAQAATAGIRCARHGT